MHIHIETQAGDLLITADALAARLAEAGFADELATGRFPSARTTRRRASQTAWVRQTS